MRVHSLKFVLIQKIFYSILLNVNLVAQLKGFSVDWTFQVSTSQTHNSKTNLRTISVYGGSSNLVSHPNSLLDQAIASVCPNSQIKKGGTGRLIRPGMKTVLKGSKRMSDPHSGGHQAGEASHTGSTQAVLGGARARRIEPAPPVLRTVSLQDFEILKLIGRGSFGKVYLVKKKSDNNVRVDQTDTVETSSSVKKHPTFDTLVPSLYQTLLTDFRCTP